MSQASNVESTTATFTIEVAYNGITKSLTVQPHETVRAALEQAIKLFGITNQPHILAFYREDNTEVTPETVSLAEARITAGTLLALRPSRVKGGAA